MVATESVVRGSHVLGGDTDDTDHYVDAAADD